MKDMFGYSLQDEFDRLSDSDKKRIELSHLMDRNLQKKIAEEKNKYPAIRVYNMLQYGYEETLRVCNGIHPLISDNINKFRKGALENEQFYSECLHGRIGSYSYKSAFPEFTEPLWHCFHLLMQSGSETEQSMGMINDTVNLVRNNVLINNWNKYRKAYVFDRELEKAFLDVDEELVFPSQMVESMPYPVVYIELPDNSSLSQYYFGAFVTLRRTTGLKEINKEVSDGFYRAVNGLNIDVDVSGSHTIEKERLMQRGYTEEQIDCIINNELNYKVMENVEDRYVSMHAILLNRQPNDLDGFDFTPYTVIMSMPYKDDELCHIPVSKIREIINQDDFDHRATVRKIVIFLLNAMMYLGAKNADIQSRVFTSEPAMSIKTKNNTKKPESVEINECGFTYGQTIREIERHRKEGKISDGEDEIIDENGQIIRVRKPPRPHPFKAHYRRYHVGKGRTKIIWKFIPAGYAGGQYGKITNVSKVQKT